MFSFIISLTCVAFLVFIGHSHMTSLPQKTMANENPLTSHILDTALGRPAANVKCTLSKLDSKTDQWTHIIERSTNSDGRIGNLISAENFTAGTYKLHFDTKGYYSEQGKATFYPYVEIAFEISEPGEHYHVPILLSNYGYSTYRGS